jgi:microcystin-dependent protein
MKKIILTLIVAFFAITFAFSQVQPFKYQSVIRDSEGNILANKNVGLRISILQGTAQTMVYREEFNKSSDEYGILELSIGTGTVLNGNYLTIDWSAVNNQLKIEIDMNGGTTYGLLGNTPILAAPISNYAVKAGGATFPAGLIMPFGGPTNKIPTGWKLCDGSEISRTTYVDLYNVIGVGWGPGDLQNTFNLPDLRGQFLRGVDGTAGVDPDKNSRTALYIGGNTGNAVGSYQPDAFDSHTHTIASAGAHTHTVKQGTTAIKWGDGGGNSTSYVDAGAGAGSYGAAVTAASDGIHTHTNSAEGGLESRAKNVYVNYIIKY